LRKFSLHFVRSPASPPVSFIVPKSLVGCLAFGIWANNMSQSATTRSATLVAVITKGAICVLSPLRTIVTVVFAFTPSKRSRGVDEYEGRVVVQSLYAMVVKLSLDRLWRRWQRGLTSAIPATIGLLSYARIPISVCIWVREFCYAAPAQANIASENILYWT